MGGIRKRNDEEERKGQKGSREKLKNQMGVKGPSYLMEQVEAAGDKIKMGA